MKLWNYDKMWKFFFHFWAAFEEQFSIIKNNIYKFKY